MSRLIINLVAFQLGWFGCVLGAANGYPMAGLVVVSVVVALHLGMSVQPRRELALIAAAGLLGVLFDSALARSGWLTYANGMIWAGTAPYWIVAMWLSFATTLNVSLRWLRGSVPAALVFGSIGGPVSYLAGERLGALQFVNTGAAVIALAVGWALATPLLIFLSERLDGVQMPPVQAPQHA